MKRYLVLLANGDKIVHEGKPDTKYGVLSFTKDVFERPFVGYAPGRWLEFAEMEPRS